MDGLKIQGFAQVKGKVQFWLQTNQPVPAQIKSSFSQSKGWLVQFGARPDSGHLYLCWICRERKEEIELKVQAFLGYNQELRSALYLSFP